jgi:hypothetical protein
MQKQIVFLAQGNNVKSLKPVDDWARERFQVERPGPGGPSLPGCNGPLPAPHALRAFVAERHSLARQRAALDALADGLLGA